MDELAGERVDAPERGDEERDERREVDKDERRQGRREQQRRFEPASAPQRGRRAAAGPQERGARRDGVDRHARSLARYLCPRLLPGVVVHAVLAAVPTIGHRGLPEVDALVVGEWLGQVGLRARAGLRLFYEWAGLPVVLGVAVNQCL